MAVTFQLPPEVEKRLRAQSSDLDAEAREISALELFRRGRLSHFELSQVLGLDRFETDAYLKHHNVVEGSLTMEDMEEQSRTLDRVLGPVRR
jgi:predicted HTH domain antitoxin